MTAIRWTRRAHRHLQAVWEYVAADNPTTAEELVQQIWDSIAILATHPLLGRVGRIEGSRELVVPGTPYIVGYDLRNDSVRILAIVHSSRNWPIAFSR